MTINVPLGIAFLAGLASFLSPCVFPLVPAYIGYLSGRSLADGTAPRRFETFTHGLAFVLGFSLVFVLLGLVVSSLGQLMHDIAPILSKVGGVVVILFGLHMTHILRIPFLEYDLRPQTQMARQRSYLSSMVMGIFFSAGWSPCTGPTLGAISTMVWNGGSIAQGAVLLSAYSAGLAIPFLAAALGIGWVTVILRRYSRAMRIVEIVMGVVLVIVGIMLFLGTFEQLARMGVFVDFGL